MPVTTTDCFVFESDKDNRRGYDYLLPFTVAYIDAKHNLLFSGNKNWHQQAETVLSSMAAVGGQVMQAHVYEQYEYTGCHSALHLHAYLLTG